MSRVSVGALRRRLTLEQAARVADGGGGAAVAWTTVTELWAAVRPLSGSERARADQLASRVTHEVWLRRRDGVLPAMRLRQGARVFEIVAVLETQWPGRLRLLCEERWL
jgi:SPP1 family predicted phage head-tail adaptor